MKTLDELVKEKELVKTDSELLIGRTGNLVVIFDDNSYFTIEDYDDLEDFIAKDRIKEIIVVKPE